MTLRNRKEGGLGMNKVKKNVLVVLFAFFVISFAGIQNNCCCNRKVSTNLVTVFQGYELRTDKFIIPLSSDDDIKILSYLKRGGDKSRSESDLVSYYDEKKYRGIINYLSREKEMMMDDFFFKDKKGKYQLKEILHQWFRKIIRWGVIDSCEPRPSMKSSRPFSLYDGYFFWVFYRDKDNIKKVTNMLITLPWKGNIIHYND